MPINKCKIIIKNIKANGFCPNEGAIEETITYPDISVPAATKSHCNQLICMTHKIDIGMNIDNEYPYKHSSSK